MGRMKNEGQPRRLEQAALELMNRVHAILPDREAPAEAQIHGAAAVIQGDCSVELAVALKEACKVAVTEGQALIRLTVNSVGTSILVLSSEDTALATAAMKPRSSPVPRDDSN